ncbi:MAG: efflux RND transporter periplasmic adaptor subunit [Polyangiaceae bacterium]
MLVAIAALAACRSEAESGVERAEPVAVRCEAPALENIEVTLALRGRLQPPPGGDAPVASQVAGRLAKIMVHEGESIKAGDVVAMVDDANTRDTLSQATAAVAQAHASEANAEVTLERTRALVARGIAARQELDDATARAGEAKANVAAASASADLARRALGRVAVRSSFAGVVTRVWRGPGMLVDGTAATPIVQLAAAGAVEFVADATSEQLSQVKEGDAARGALGGDRTFAGTVFARAMALDPTTGLGTVRIALTSWDLSAPIGAYGRAVIAVSQRSGVRVLPTSALRGAIADGAEVAVCNDGVVHLRKVKVGWRDDEKFEVAGGVADGERVAVDHVLGLEDGTAIVERR